MKAEHITDRGTSFQKSSEGEVSFGRPVEYIAIDIYPYYTFFEATNKVEYSRFPSDDEHIDKKKI